ncbi:MAG: ABC transporter ATP-binding protein [Candidatus Marinimicrobia bacterium]|nr:ABC transporter ATP-binding protein [Candidatus Neomarinimicrobiota bacterium]MCF7851048.1 ABC transporter ATP-binding protein [Candidatus Neomarinimicrobiota bacterium]
MSENMLTHIENLETVFTTDEGTVKAVDDVSFSLEKGRTVGVVGESGSGKSVTSLSLMRLIPNPPGQIVGGKLKYHSRTKGLVDLAEVPEKEMREFRGNEIAMIFQEPMTSLNPVFTCGDQVMEALILHRQMSKADARARTLELFQEVELPRPEAIIDSYPHQLSGGQKQRVMIAMAMSCNPRILIADEPTTALDVTVQATILDLMRKLRDTHDMGIIFITHDLGVIAEIADHVVVMYKGKVVEQGSVWEIFSKPQHPYTKGLLACRPPLDHRLKLLPTISDFMDENEAGEMVEIKRSVDEAINELIVTAEETDKRHESLYAQEPILTVENLKTYFPIREGLFSKVVDHVRAVDDVSFDVFPGETLGLVGESGCGKTTLGRTILRLIEPTAGKIIFDGRDITHISGEDLRAIHRRIQIIFQDPYSSLNPRITIGSAIMEPMQVHGLHADETERRQKVQELLERVNLDPGHYNRYPHEFSGGQRQRICIARALAVQPEFIICDESVSALDVSVQAQVLNLLNELRDDFGLTYIFISHDLSVVKFMSDRMVVMNDGKIEEMGKADEVYQNPQTEYTKRLIAAIPRGDLKDIEASYKARIIN